MQPGRRILLAAFAAVAAGGRWQAVRAQDTQLEQARILVGFPPGGGTDASARRLADGLRGTYARTVVVDNKPGAAGKLVVEELLRGAADGSLLVVQPEAVVTQQPLVDPRTTRFAFEDLQPVGGIGLLTHAFAVGPAVPEAVRSLRDFVEWARANPAKANFGTPGNNSSQDFLMRAGARDLGIQLTHAPYRGSAPGVQDLIAGQIAAFFSPVGDALPHLASGRMRLLATSGDRRSRFAPDVPTFAEQGLPQMSLTEWFGVWMAKTTSEATRARAAAAVRQAVEQPATVEALARFGIDAVPITQADFAAAMRASHAAWAERLRRIGFRPET